MALPSRSLSRTKWFSFDDETSAIYAYVEGYEGGGCWNWRGLKVAHDESGEIVEQHAAWDEDP